MTGPASIALDRWLVHPAALYQSLKTEWAPRIDSALMTLRLAGASVQYVDTLPALVDRLHAMLNEEVAPIRIVLPHVSADLLDALDAAALRTVEPLHLYGFEDRPEDVLASLCTPEPWLQEAYTPDDVLRLTIGGQELSLTDRRQYAAAVDEWRHARDQAEASFLGDDPVEEDWFDWSELPPLTPNTANDRPRIRHADATSLSSAPVIVPSFAPSADDPSRPQPGSAEWELRWQCELAGIDGFAAKVRIMHCRGPAPGGHTMHVWITIAQALEPGPDRIRLTLGRGRIIGDFDQLRWRLDCDDTTSVTAMPDPRPIAVDDGYAILADCRSVLTLTVLDGDPAAQELMGATT
jgi:hypothetical protein